MVAAALLVATRTGGACEPGLRMADAQRVEGAHYVLAWRTLRADPPGRVLRPRRRGVHEERRRRAAATCASTRSMPDHQHGMNYRPTVAAAGDGRFAARGLMFHMPGAWELSFDVNPGGVPRETLRSPVALP